MTKPKKPVRKIKPKEQKMYSVRGVSGLPAFLEAVKAGKVAANSILVVKHFRITDYKRKANEIFKTFAQIMNAGVEIGVLDDGIHIRRANVDELVRGMLYSARTIAGAKQRKEGESGADLKQRGKRKNLLKGADFVK